MTRNTRRRGFQDLAAAAASVPQFRHLVGTRASRLNEQDYRLEILNALLKTPHRKIEPYVPLFHEIHERDPLFFFQLACWYFDHGSVNDLKQLFIAYLFISRFSERFRQCAKQLMMRLPPFQVERVLWIIKGRNDPGNYVPGIATNVPRSFKTAVKEYLQEREKSEARFESAVLHARNSLKALYGSLRIKPSEYAQRVLFEDNPPEGSRLHALKMISWTDNAEEQALLIVENRIPYRAAVGVIKHVSPPVLVALIEVMSPQEMINSLASLRRHGAFDNPDVKAMIELKLEEGKTDKRVSALKTRKALAAAGGDDAIDTKVRSIGDERIKAAGRIKLATGLLIDKSASMEEAIELGKMIASIVAPVCESDLYVYAFDSIAYEVKSQGKELSHWEDAFRGINAGGSTSCGIAVEMMRKAKQKVSQLVIVTDQQENYQPFLATALRHYAKEFEEMPYVIIVNVGDHNSQLEDALRKQEIEVDAFTFAGDYYSLPSLVPMLAKGTRTDLLLDIMVYPAPT